MMSLASGAPAIAECDLNQVVEVSVKNMAFVPQHVEVCLGQTVRWTNQESGRQVHTVTLDPARARRPENVQLPEGATPFHSGLLQPGQSYEQVFQVVGEYKYFCAPHELMGHLGSIRVIANDQDN
jgi:plastocyanin